MMRLLGMGLLVLLSTLPAVHAAEGESDQPSCRNPDHLFVVRTSLSVTPLVKLDVRLDADAKVWKFMTEDAGLLAQIPAFNATYSTYSPLKDGPGEQNLTSMSYPFHLSDQCFIAKSGNESRVAIKVSNAIIRLGPDEACTGQADFDKPLHACVVSQADKVIPLQSQSFAPPGHVPSSLQVSGESGVTNIHRIRDAPLDPKQDLVILGRNFTPQDLGRQNATLSNVMMLKVAYDDYQASAVRLKTLQHDENLTHAVSRLMQTEARLNRSLQEFSGGQQGWYGEGQKSRELALSIIDRFGAIFLTADPGCKVAPLQVGHPIHSCIRIGTEVTSMILSPDEARVGARIGLTGRGSVELPVADARVQIAPAELELGNHTLPLRQGVGPVEVEALAEGHARYVATLSGLAKTRVGKEDEVLKAYEEARTAFIQWRGQIERTLQAGQGRDAVVDEADARIQAMAMERLAPQVARARLVLWVCMVGAAAAGGAGAFLGVTRIDTSYRDRAAFVQMKRGNPRMLVALALVLLAGSLFAISVSLMGSPLPFLRFLVGSS